ncbi:MAG: GGDEF domain-containing protein [Actinomycetes bacterium]
MALRDHTDFREAYATAYDDAAKHDLPYVAGIGAILFALFAAYDVATHVGDHTAVRLISSLGPATVLAGIAIWTRRVLPAHLAPWVVVVGALAAVAGPLATVVFTDHASDLGYAMVIIGATGAVVYRERPFYLFMTIALVAYVLVAMGAPVSRDTLGDWVATGLMATGMGSALFTVRRFSVRQMAHANEQLVFLAGHDALTGLVNRHGLETAGPTVLALARREGRTVFAAFVDIDRLSEINNEYGHGAGDEVIRTVADALREVVRDADVVSRWGGDEIVLVGIGDGPDARRIEEAVRDFAVRNSAVPGWDGQVSVGVVALPSVDTSFEGLILTADAEMYERRGRRRSGVA